MSQWVTQKAKIGPPSVDVEVATSLTATSLCQFVPTLSDELSAVNHLAGANPVQVRGAHAAYKLFSSTAANCSADPTGG
jgi:hypothetical protein